MGSRSDQTCTGNIILPVARGVEAVEDIHGDSTTPDVRPWHWTMAVERWRWKNTQDIIRREATEALGDR